MRYTVIVDRKIVVETDDRIKAYTIARQKRPYAYKVTVKDNVADTETVYRNRVTYDPTVRVYGARIKFY